MPDFFHAPATPQSSPLCFRGGEFLDIGNWRKRVTPERTDSSGGGGGGGRGGGRGGRGGGGGREEGGFS